MGNYLNPGNEKFRRMIQSEIYVDKTGMIKYTNSVLDTAQTMSVSAVQEDLGSQWLRIC